MRNVVNKVRIQIVALAKVEQNAKITHHIMKTRKDIDIEKNGGLLLLKMVCSRMDSVSKHSDKL